jgi:hypothetical protein
LQPLSLKLQLFVKLVIALGPLARRRDNRVSNPLNRSFVGRHRRPLASA